MPNPPLFPTAHWSKEHRSAFVFACLLGLVLMAVAFPELAPQALQGILWAVAGLLIYLFPPPARLPRSWWLLAGGFVLFSAAGFLPRGWFEAAPWRGELEALGLDTGSRGIVQPRAAAESLAGFAATVLVGLFMLGHRVGSHFQLRIALAFALGVAVWCLLAMLRHQPDQEMIFGFFPNRNHTASLLVMGFFAGLGCLAHGIDRQRGRVILLAAIPVTVLLYALAAVSESRAGIVLLVAGFLAWIPLAGPRYLRGHAGKAVLLLLFVLAGMFGVMESRVKDRLAAGFDEIRTAAETGTAATDPAAATGTWADKGRVAIYRDTWRMIRGEPWTGVGPGQFVWVFPQYRDKIRLSGETPCLHPDSDWLMMLAENGWPAAACLAAGVAAVIVSGLASARSSHRRGLRMSCLVAGALLCLHGVFDVPGHRVGLAWSAILLVAISLRPQESGAPADPPVPHRFRGPGWRLSGMILFAAGLWLVLAQWTGRPALPSAVAGHQLREVERLHRADRAAAENARAAGMPPPSRPDADPLARALDHVDRAIAIHPLDPHPHFVRGALALHFVGGEEAADRSFAIQRRLSPLQVSIVLDQARAWSRRDPAKAGELWNEAFERATADQQRFYWTQFSVAKSYLRILPEIARSEALAAIALDLAGRDFELLGLWAREAPPAALDRYLPRILTGPLAPEQRQALMEVWRGRGSKEAIEAFAREHSEE
jgi:O-antigen ligase